MLAHLLSTVLALTPPEGVRPADARVSVVVDSARREIVITAGPVSIPASTLYGHHAKQEYIAIEWPVSGWLRGYRVDLADSNGTLLSREMIHHVGLVNLERRQLAYPYAERLLAAARETKPFLMPESMGVPLSADDQTILYYALVNPGSSDVNGVLVRVTIAWTPSNTRRVRNVLPLYANAKDQDGTPISFDIPPGRSTTSAEFTMPVAGFVRALGGHLHDYGVELRLEDAVSNKVLARLRAERSSTGVVRGVHRTKFLLKRRGLRLHDNHRYRVVAVYDNPTSQTVAAGAMGLIVGAFIPDDLLGVQRVDTADAAFQRDLRAITASVHGGAHH